MQYKYSSNDNYEDFASGRVIYHRTGLTNFPIRLAQEIYSRCIYYLEVNENICIYDPCCGGGYLLTSLAFLNYDMLKAIVCSDINGEALKVTKENLSLLTKDGLNNRILQLEKLYLQFGKQSHLDACKSAKSMQDRIAKHNSNIDVNIFQADILKEDALEFADFKTDIVFADIPYSKLTFWHGNIEDTVNKFLLTLIPVLKPNSVVAICSDKSQKIKSELYKRLEKHQVGKRKFEILRMKKN